MNEQADFLDLLQSTPRAPERQLPRFEDMDWQEERRRLLLARHEHGTRPTQTACPDLPPAAPSCL